MGRRQAIGAAVALLGTGAHAQQVFHWPAPAAYTATPQSRYFPIGTPVALAVGTDVTTRDARPGDRITFAVAESLVYRGQIVLPAGAPAVGEVVRSEKRDHFGKRGHLEVALLYVETPWGQVRLTGQEARQGRSGTAASIATIVLVSPLGALITGTSARLPFGAVVRATLAEPLRFQEDETPPQVAGIAVRPDTGPPAPAGS